MRIRTTFVSGLIASAALLAPGVARADSLLVSGNTVQASPATCVNLLSSGACAASTSGTQTTTPAATSTGTDSLTNISGNAVNLSPAVCANVLSSGACGASTATSQTAATSTGTGTVGTGGGLLAVTGNAVNVSPATCLNVLSSGACVASTTTTQVTTATNGGLGGGSITFPTTGNIIAAVGGLGGGSLPNTGSWGWLTLVISFMGAAASAIYVSRQSASIS